MGVNPAAPEPFGGLKLRLRALSSPKKLQSVYKKVALK
jgi:hypothetical protein